MFLSFFPEDVYLVRKTVCDVSLAAEPSGRKVGDNGRHAVREQSKAKRSSGGYKASCTILALNKETEWGSIHIHARSKVEPAQ